MQERDNEIVPVRPRRPRRSRPVIIVILLAAAAAVLLALKNKAVRGKESGENEVRAKESRVDEQCTFDNDSGCRSSGYSRTQSSAISDFRWK